MAQPSTLPQGLMTGALLHFEQMVPIDDCDLTEPQKKRLARVSHVYQVWLRNPFLSTFDMFRQMIKGKYADAPSEYRAAQKDQALLDFIIDHLQTNSRRKDEAKVRKAAEHAIRIGMETDNVVALTKGGKLLYDVAGLDKPESENMDASKVMFIPPVVTTNVQDVDPTKENVSDEQALLIMKKYGAAISEHRRAVDDRVEVMMARHEADGMSQQTTSEEEEDYEQTGNEPEQE